MRIALLFVLALSLASCDALSDSVDEAACQASGYANTGTVSASAAGSRFSATCVRGNISAGVLTITGVDNVVSANRQRSITVAADAEVGEYTINGGGAEGIYAARTEDSDDQADETYLGVSGTVVVEAVTDESAEGTFSFTARNTAGDEVVVTDGRFDVEF